ncbi:MAG: glycosyltransferase [Weeksellaceae bacterium]|nr:glycosyltransferase [Weeksellaceae bacterium]
MPAVSVIIPNYNHASFLRQRIDAVLEQTFQDFEVIILDDCSTDHSRTIIDGYQDNAKISTVVYNESNSGSVFRQWVKGIKMAKGEYIWIAESDDYADAAFLSETLALLNRNSSCGAAFTNSYIVDEASHILDQTDKRLSLSSLLKDRLITIKDIETSFINNMLISNVSSCLFRTSSLLNVDLEELQNYKSSGDRFAFIAIALNNDICYHPSPLNFFRIHHHNTTKSNMKDGTTFSERFDVLNFYLDRLALAADGKRAIVKFIKFHFIIFLNVVNKQKIHVLLDRLHNKSIINTPQHFLLTIYTKVSKELRNKQIDRLFNFILHKI